MDELSLLLSNSMTFGIPVSSAGVIKQFPLSGNICICAGLCDRICFYCACTLGDVGRRTLWEDVLAIGRVFTTLGSVAGAVIGAHSAYDNSMISTPLQIEQGGLDGVNGIAK